GDLVRQVRELGLDQRLAALDEAATDLAQRGGALAGAVLEDALARLEAQVEAVEGGVLLLQFVHHPQRLQVVLEAAPFPHAGVEFVLARVAEGRMAEVVGERDRLDQVLVQPQAARDRAGDLGHLDRMRQAGAEEIALVVDEDLGLVLEPAKGRGMNDPVAIALEIAAPAGRFLGMAPAATEGGIGGPGRAAALHRAQPIRAAMLATTSASGARRTTARPRPSSSTNFGMPCSAFLSTLMSSR